MSSQVVVCEFKKGREAKLLMIFLHKKTWESWNICTTIGLKADFVFLTQSLFHSWSTKSALKAPHIMRQEKYHPIKIWKMFDNNPTSIHGQLKVIFLKCSTNHETRKQNPPIKVCWCRWLMDKHLLKPQLTLTMVTRQKQWVHPENCHLGGESWTRVTWPWSPWSWRTLRFRDGVLAQKRHGKNTNMLHYMDFWVALQATNISIWGKRKIIFKNATGSGCVSSQGGALPRIGQVELGECLE